MSGEGLDTRAIVQVGFVVRDIERAIAAFSRLLGAPEPEIIVTDPYESARTQYRGEPTEARAKLAFFPMGPVSLEFIEPVGGPSTWQEFLDEHGPGIHHIALMAKGTDQVVASLCQKGASLAQGGYYTGGRYTYLDTDPELGFVLELLENLDESDPD
jgi:methylmalonyl-CoA/ethylmalonyl-CoA epimerase